MHCLWLCMRGKSWDFIYIKGLMIPNFKKTMQQKNNCNNRFKWAHTVSSSAAVTSHGATSLLVIVLFYSIVKWKKKHYSCFQRAALFYSKNIISLPFRGKIWADIYGRIQKLKLSVCPKHGCSFLSLWSFVWKFTDKKLKCAGCSAVDNPWCVCVGSGRMTLPEASVKLIMRGNRKVQLE